MGTPDEIATQLHHRLNLGFDVLMVNPLRTDDDAAHEDRVLEILGGL
jgi:alkanesulfonate monooxygenase SsuD/methylene tetrahydromethanopterin reductase-like flavin-dependent oxidoreductase (luciferase family)